jgi:hypothetical protein
MMINIYEVIFVFDQTLYGNAVEIVCYKDGLLPYHHKSYQHHWKTIWVNWTSLKCNIITVGLLQFYLQDTTTLLGVLFRISGNTQVVKTLPLFCVKSTQNEVQRCLKSAG